jgi:ligand-binding sensor domain-containing protein/two-component sensor histidine kinase
VIIGIIYNVFLNIKNFVLNFGSIDEMPLFQVELPVMKIVLPAFIKYITIIIFTQLTFSFAQCQQTISLPFETLTINDGLSQGFVSSIIQDKMGFMWFGTNDGLNRYDGYKFTVYYHNPFDSASLADNQINCLYEDSKQRLWIGTQHSGIDIFDRQHLTFIHLPRNNKNSLLGNTVVSINEDKSGAFWIVTDEGIDRLTISDKNISEKNDRSMQDFFSRHQLLITHIMMPDDTIKKSIPVQRLYVDGNNVFAQTNSGIYQIIYNNHSYRLIQKFSSSPELEGMPFLFKNQYVNEWFMQNQIGIYKFTGKDFSNPKKIYQPVIIRNRLMVDREGRIWIGDENKTVLIDKIGAVKTISANNKEIYKFLGGVNSFYTDRNDVIWIGTYGYGILKLNPEKEIFHSILPQVTSYQLATENNNQIIANSLLHITIKDDQLIKVDSIKNQTHSECIAVDESGNYWRSAGGAILYCNTKSIFKKIDLSSMFKNNTPFPLCLDDDKIWIGCKQNFLQYDIATNTFKVYNYPIRQDKDIFDFLQCIYKDSDSVLWLGTQNGLMRFNTQNASWKYYTQKNDDSTSLSNNDVFSVCNDPFEPNKYLWVGTNGGGLNRFDKLTGKFFHYTVEDGLPNNVVYGILPDDRGNLWMSTNKGLSEFNVQNKTFRNFDVNDGLQGNEFDRYAYCKTKNGLLFFGGVNGINFFNPDKIKALQPPQVLITDFRLFNKTVSIKTPGSPLTKDVLYTDAIQLKYDQNVITFQFAATDYRRTGNVYYRYIMKGFDKDWINSGTFREATYTNLNPGKYYFTVEASNDGVQWSTNDKTISIEVIPPWWRTWWFYALIVIITASIIYSIYQYRLKQVLKLQGVRNRIATDLHDEIGSSLSTISIYSKVAQAQLKNDAAESGILLKKISEDTNEMMDAMNDIVWTINARNDRFENIINRMREHAIQLFEVKDCLLHFNFDEQLNHLKFDMEKRKDFYLIYKEALNNIAKYAEANNVWIELAIEKTEIILSIKDDGKGFDKNAVRKSANGLINMQNRAANLNGEIEIKSDFKKGTEICLSFPYH